VFVSQLPTPFEVEIPQTLARREVGEQAATLSILLAGFAGPSTEPVVPAPRVLPRIAARHTMPVAPQTPFRVTPPEGWPRPLTMAPIGGPVSGGGGGHIGWKSVSGTNAPPQGSGDRVPRHSGMQ